MPVRPHTRDQGWLLPPHLEELVSADHPARFVAEFVDQVDAAAWRELGVQIDGEARGAPAYHPRLLLSVWLYGFMTGVRSSRRLETACRENLPYLWLSGLQTPDHNTLWRFYEAHRDRMRTLLKRTVQVAVATGLVDLALQAVDGSKVLGNASKARTHRAETLRRIRERTEQAIAELEAQNQTGGEAAPPSLPEELTRKEALREKVGAALRQAEAEGRQVNLTDGDAVLLRVRGGYITGYNAQAVASPLARQAGRRGQLITATDVSQKLDRGQLMPMLEAAEENQGRRSETSLADAGYHSAANVERCQEQRRTVLMPEPEGRPLDGPYHKDAFLYDPASDTYTCPQGQTLYPRPPKRDRKGREVRLYRGEVAVCRACPAFGLCTTNRRHGRELQIGPHDAALRFHRSLMASQNAKTMYGLRQGLIEPVFGIIKEQLAGRRFLLRGLANVTAEWSLLAVAFNLRILARCFRS